MNAEMVTPTEGYACPRAEKTLDALLSIPGSKSLTNRELVLAAIAEGPSTIRGGLVARDTQLMIDALELMGAQVEMATDSDGVPLWTITPISFASLSSKPIVIDCGLAGTVMRFLPPLSLLGFQPVTFTGDEQARARPMGPVIDALRQLGAVVDDGGSGTLPFTVTPGGLPTSDHTIRIDASASSQFVSGLLLAAARFPATITIEHTGSRLPSVPHIDMTIETLANRGVDVDYSGSGRWSVMPQSIDALDITIEPDLSNAAPFLAAALVAGGTVSVRDWPASTTQVGDQLRSLLREFGALVDYEDSVLSVHGAGVGPGIRLNPVSLDLSEAGELAPTLITLSLFSSGTSTFKGIGHLRGHETNRLAALVENIHALGGVATETSDGIIVTPAPLHGGTWKAFGDHRMATSGALVGLAVDGVVVDDIAQTGKTLPEFVALWDEMRGSRP
jgi:3-phosphoshikimate 1-carboxyvinyltransferase